MDLQLTYDAKRIFLSHGSNHKARDELADFLRELGLYPVIAEKEPSQSRDPGQKVRRLIASSACAVVLATRDEETREGWKPRQNVIHEIALLEERLSSKFVVLKEEGTVLPSNVSLTYVPFPQGQVTGSYTGLLRELKSILEVPLNFSKSSGDIAQISKDKKPEEWDCRDDILTKENKNYVQTNSKVFGRNAIITFKPVSLEQRIDVNGIKLTLKYADNNEISDDTILTLFKGDIFIENYGEIGKYEYGDLKRKITLKNKAPLSFYDTLAICLEENYVGKEVISETIKFYVDSCFKKNTRKSPF